MFGEEKNHRELQKNQREIQKLAGEMKGDWPNDFLGREIPKNPRNPIAEKTK